MRSQVKNLDLNQIDQLGQMDDAGKSISRIRLIFGDSALIHNPKMASALEQLPRDVIAIGCSTAGEIFNAEVKDHTVSVADLFFDRTKVRLAQFPIANSENSAAVGNQIGKALASTDLQGILVLSDGLNVNGSQLIEGLNAVVGEDVVVTGGLAADGADFKSTWVLVDRVPKAGFVTAIGFYGKNIQLSHGSQGGWDIFGPGRTITKATNNVLYEIDNQPALELYKKYLGTKAAELPASALLFPIKIWKPGAESNALVRTILAVNENDKSMTFAGDMPVGYSAQLMRANFDRLIEGAANAAVSMGAIRPGFSLAISCVGRKLLLGDRTEEEVSAVIERLPKGTPQVGFYSYGEISPLARGEKCHLHNQTMTLTFFSEIEDKNAA